MPSHPLDGAKATAEIGSLSKLPLGDLEQGESHEIAPLGLPNRLPGAPGLLLANCDQGPAGAGGGGVGGELDLAALLQEDEPGNGGLDGGAGSQEPVVAEQGGLLAAEAGGDCLALVGGEDESGKLAERGGGRRQ